MRCQGQDLHISQMQAQGQQEQSIQMFLETKLHRRQKEQVKEDKS